MITMSFNKLMLIMMIDDDSCYTQFAMQYWALHIAHKAE